MRNPPSMPTDSFTFSPLVPRGESRFPSMDPRRESGRFTACRMTTEVFINTAAEKPVAAALSGWISRYTADDLPIGRDRLAPPRRPQPGHNFRTAHA